MANVFDVAKYILRKAGPMSAMKLQKLIYYSQAWALVWDDNPLFPERIEAWANGPVVPDLFNAHRGKFKLSEQDFPKGDPAALAAHEQDTIDVVVAFYGEKSAQWLSDLTHSETPWKQAREGLPEGERGSNEISLESLSEYYSSLV